MGGGEIGKKKSSLNDKGNGYGNDFVYWLDIIQGKVFARNCVFKLSFCIFICRF